jgi:hypothetical protein
MTTFIYELIDPTTSETRYIGKSNNPQNRFLEHYLFSNESYTHKNNWINKLKSQGIRPQLKILDEVDLDEWRFWEKFYIALYKSWGFNLLNYTGGGDGLSTINSTSFKSGRQPWNLGRPTSSDVVKKWKQTRIKNGTWKQPFSQETKDQMRKSAIGKPKSEEHKQKILKNGENTRWTKGRKPWNKEKTGTYSTSKGKSIQQLSINGLFIKEWKNANQAQNTLKIDGYLIGLVCRGKNKTAGGFKWKYKEI